MTRFTAFVILAFVLTFAAVYWAMQGFPFWTQFRSETSAQLPVIQPLKPAAEGPEFKAFSREESAAMNAMQRRLDEKLRTVRSEDPLHDRERYTVVREAANYIFSPCTPDSKKRLISAIIAYVQAYRDMRACIPGVTCSGEQMGVAWRTFTTSELDSLVQQFIGEAYQRGGISSVDFASVGAGFQGDLAAITNLDQKTPRPCGPAQPLPTFR